jgi:hypothetical protein
MSLKQIVSAGIAYIVYARALFCCRTIDSAETIARSRCVRDELVIGQANCLVEVTGISLGAIKGTEKIKWIAKGGRD